MTETETAGPHRRCLAGGGVQPRHALLRFVVGPDGRVVPDMDERLPGRGLWLSPSRNMINIACRKGLFSRAARQQVSVDDDLADRVEALLLRRIQDTLGLARRAGQAVAGFEKVMARLRTGPAALLLQARDGAPDSLGRVAHAAGALPVRRVLTAEELGAGLGRAHSVHVVVAPGALADRLERDCGRLAGLREVSSDAAVLTARARDPEAEGGPRGP